MSAADGGFLFETVPVGTYDLEFYAPGFVKQKLVIEVANGASRALTTVLKVGSMPDMNDCGPHPSIRYGPFESRGPHLSGVVRDYFEQKPVAEAAVSLWRTGEQWPAFTSHLDQTGRFEFNDVPANRYDLRISRRGYWPAELGQLLIPRESSVAVEFPILKRNRIVVCQ
jgi:Carboxypeptidase regulatory-like domain